MKILLAPHFRLVLLLAVVASAISGVVHANGVTGKDVATESHFHLTANLQFCRDRVERVVEVKDTCAGDVTERGIFGNLFTFTHPGTPNSAVISQWSAELKGNRDKNATIQGSLTIDVDLPDQSFGSATGQIMVSFNVGFHRVPFSPFVAEEPNHWNFEGPFQITGGTGFYAGIQGQGTMGGTVHGHPWGENSTSEEGQRPWQDFVMIGTAQFPGSIGGSTTAGTNGCAFGLGHENPWFDGSVWGENNSNNAKSEPGARADQVGKREICRD